MSLTAAKKAFEVAKTNLAFAKLSKPKQRVVIAKDVIFAVRAKWLKATAGIYLHVKDNEGDKITSCEACALGSMLVCASRYEEEEEDHYWANEQNEIYKRLALYFSKAQLYLIEEAFEAGSILTLNAGRIVSNSAYKRAVQFGIKQKAADKRLVAVMKNIIKNKGNFKP